MSFSSPVGSLPRRHHGRTLISALGVLLLAGSGVQAQEAPKQPPQEPKPWMELYGFAMLDVGENFTRIDPDWYDTMRVTKLPAFEKEYGEDGDFFGSVRQTRFGVKTSTPTKLGDLKTQFEFELFGTGVDAGQTTFRLRHAYGELGAFGAGQYWSPFMDIDVFPNSLEYWGPTGMAFFRNVQVRWMPIRGETRLTLAIERPGASGDQGVYADRIELENIKARFPLPDVSGEYRLGRPWGYVEVAGILRYIKWDDMLDDKYDLSGSTTGWGLNVSSNLKAGPRSTIRLQLVYGEGIENYMNDAPVDIAIQNNFSNPVSPIKGKALPILGIVAFLDHNWNERWSSAVGYSRTDIDNTDGQAPEAYKTGQYALGNLLFSPVPNMMVGGELQWGRRENYNDGFHSDGVKVQFSFKYNFSYKLGG
jgi:DcaP outer membrane protein